MHSHELPTHKEIPIQHYPLCRKFRGQTGSSTATSEFRASNLWCFHVRGRHEQRLYRIGTLNSVIAFYSLHLEHRWQPWASSQACGRRLSRPSRTGPPMTSQISLECSNILICEWLRTISFMLPSQT